MKATYTLPPLLDEVAALNRENKRLQDLLDSMEHFRSSAETALALAAEKERTAVVAMIREYWDTDSAREIADNIERGEHLLGKS